MKKYKAILLVMLLALQANNIISLAATDKSQWKIEASHANDSAKNIIDGDVTTYWHSPITDPKTLPPFEITITFPEEETFSGIEYVPRTTGGSDSGIVMGYNIYLAESDTGEFSLVESGSLPQNKDTKTIHFDSNIKAKKLKFEVTEGLNGYGVIAELDILSPAITNQTKTISEYSQYKAKTVLKVLDKKGFVAKSDSEWNETLAAQNVFDGKSGYVNSIWHYKPYDPMPIVLNIDFNSVVKLAAFKFYPRPKDLSGHWLEYNMYGSLDGESFEPIIKNGTFEADFNDKMVRFPGDKSYKVRYVKFEILKGYNGHVSCGELDFYQFQTDVDEYLQSNVEEYELKIASNTLKITKGNEVKNKEMDVSPFIAESSTLIPLRGLLEEMGAEFTWDGTKDLITVKKGDKTMAFQVENNLVYIGDIRYTLTVAPRISNGRTFIPLRFISEHLGYNVAWDGKTQTITITKPL
ncbi:MAG: discoidin domain-containing protein [Bacillota bacterium]|nr:discoidin domain-containing protein [Bacillota bacterium]